MTGVGADLATLRELYNTFTTKAQDAEGIKTDVDSSLTNAVWTGRYSQEFRDAWEEYKTNLDTLRTALEGAAEDVKMHHNQQAETSGESDYI